MKSKNAPARAGFAAVHLLPKLPIALAVLLAVGTVAVQADPVPDGAPLTSGFGYDAEGNLTTVNLPKGSGQPTARQQIHKYDSLGRRVYTNLPPPASGASSPTLTYGYDGLDQIKSVTTPINTANPPLLTTYTTSGLGNTSVLASPDTGTANADYYEDGLLKTRTDARGRTFKYFYDDLGRLTKITYNSGTASQFEYDGVVQTANNSTGQLSKLTDEAGTTTYTHDGLGRVISKTQLVSTTPQRSFALGQAWGDTGTEASKLKSQTYPSFAKLNYTYDAAGRLQSITLNPVKSNGTGTNNSQTITLVSAIGYSPLNAAQSWIWGGTGGVPYTLTYDENGRLKSYPLGNPSGTGKAAGVTRTVNYDDAGRIASFAHTNASGAAVAYDQTYAHDGLDRLTQQQQQASAYEFDYDLNGNRKGQTIGGTPYTNTLDTASNRLLKERNAQGVTTFSYDPAGDLKSDGPNTYTHSARGRLSSVTLATGSVNYLYNGLQQRLVKTSTNTSLVPGGARYYMYDEQRHMIGEYDQDGNPVYEVVYLGDTPAAVITQVRTVTNGVLSVQTKVSYVYADHLATPRVIVRASDHFIQWRWDQAEAYGATPPNENPNALGQFSFNLRFPGQFFDAESNLVYNHHRYYDASTGRYVESDPIGLNGGSNTYAYVDGDPLGIMDSLGLKGADHPGEAACIARGNNPIACQQVPLQGPPAQDSTSYFGAEGHFLVGGGLTSVTCTDECGKKQVFRYWKLCGGAAVGISGGFGLVSNMSGKNCRVETYKGWFFENGASWGVAGGGVDIGYNQDGPFNKLPGSLSGVNEASLGLGLGVSFKSTWCYYIPLD